MLYSLCFQWEYPGTVVIARSTSLLKLLKIKAVTFSENPGAFITDGNEQFNKFDLTADELARFRDFDDKRKRGRYFPTYDYGQKSRTELSKTTMRT